MATLQSIVSPKKTGLQALEDVQPIEDVVTPEDDTRRKSNRAVNAAVDFAQMGFNNNFQGLANAMIDFASTDLSEGQLLILKSLVASSSGDYAQLGNMIGKAVGQQINRSNTDASGT